MRTLVDFIATLEAFYSKFLEYEKALAHARDGDYRLQEEKRRKLSVTWGELAGDVQALGVSIAFEVSGKPVLIFENALRPQAPRSLAPITSMALPFARQAIETAIGRAKSLAEGKAVTPQGSPPRHESGVVSPKKVFIVHGQDSGLLNELQVFLTSLGLDPVVLKDKPQGGRTLIEKFEDYSDVSYAIVLLTPDDVGRPASTESAPLVPRARQNAILEWGFFMGKRGRERVAVMYKSGVEKPSDIDGIAYIPADDVGWRMHLVQELSHAGFSLKLS